MNDHPASSSQTLWATTLLVVALCLFMGLIQWIGMAEFTSHASRSSPWWSIAAYAFLPWIPWLVVAPGIAYLALRYRIGVGPVWKRIMIHVMGGAIIACSIMLLLRWAEPMVVARIGQPYFTIEGVEFPAGQGPFLLGEDGVPDANDIPPEIVAQMLRGMSEQGGEVLDSFVADHPTVMVAASLTGFITYAVFVLLINGLLFYRDLRSREATAIRLEAELAKTQLQTLQGQLHPHFLFNTLSSIKTLMASDVETAGHMLTRLADLLRASLRDLQENEVSLSQELAFIRSYLEIEQIRFGPDLKIVFDIEADTEQASVPTFCLQPLVENAIKHGVGRRVSLGEIHVSACRRANTLCIEVTDDGPGLPADMPRPVLGIGLKNTQARIDQLYGEQGSMDIDAPSDGGFTVRLHLPYYDVSDRTPEQSTDV